RLGRARRLGTEPEPADEVLGALDGLRAELLLDLLAGLVLLAEVGDDSPEAASGLADPVMGVDQQPADAVVELADDPVALVREEPAGLRRSRHRVVGSRDRHLIDPLAAELRIA